MVSNFKNSNLAYYLYTSVVILIGAASIFVFWYMVSGFNIGKYSENTFIGSVYIGGLTEQEAEEKLRRNIDAWLTDERVVFEASYQGYTYMFDRNLIFFDIDRSLNAIQDGRTNELFVSYDETVRAQVLFAIEQQTFMETLVDQFNLEALLDALLSDAARMRTFSSRQLDAYIINEDNLFIVLADASLSTQSWPETSEPLNAIQLYNKLFELFPDGRIPIAPNSIFSVLQRFPTLTPAELSFMGSLLLDLISTTHFNIHERYYQPPTNDYYEIADFTLYGKNVLVRQSQQRDFSFENNSFSRYRIQFELVGDTINLSLIGAPFLNTVESEIDFVYLPYPVETVQSQGTDQSGREGVLVFVYRNTFDINGNLIKEQTILIEYYPPRMQITFTEN